MKETYIQIGVTALRSPKGDFLPSVPVYIKSAEAVKASGLTESEENALHDIGALFALKHLQITGGK
jgi:hypothetical protein